MKSLNGCLLAILLLAAFLVLSGAFYTVDETKQVVITQFGEPRGEPINSLASGKNEAGLHFKIPFIWVVNEFDKHILEWDGRPEEMPTKDKTYIRVDTYARWRIHDPLQYFRRLRDERSALSRLDDILGSETRNTIAKNELIEAVRTTAAREAEQPEEIAETELAGTIGELKPIRLGRSALEQEIFENSRGKLTEFGIELLDIRFKRINYNETVQERIFERMISERQQIAERFRSEGAGEAAKILGNMEKELLEIKSTAYRTVQTLRGEADAKAAAIYASAYNQNAESAEFYRFLRTMELYEEMLGGGGSTAVLSTNSDIFRYLKRIDAGPDDLPSLPLATGAASAPDPDPVPAAARPVPPPAPATAPPSAPAEPSTAEPSTAEPSTAEPSPEEPE